MFGQFLIDRLVDLAWMVVLKRGLVLAIDGENIVIAETSGSRKLNLIPRRDLGKASDVARGVLLLNKIPRKYQSHPTGENSLSNFIVPLDGQLWWIVDWGNAGVTYFQEIEDKIQSKGEDKWADGLRIGGPMGAYWVDEQ